MFYFLLINSKTLTPGSNAKTSLDKVDDSTFAVTLDGRRAIDTPDPVVAVAVRVGAFAPRVYTWLSPSLLDMENYCTH
ncbi:hypothetical protein NOK12_39180 [Nocardioides sp. OK12]|nr:hypothetical protein NOK12_39180 [Nocardioides sp. OK12]